MEPSSLPAGEPYLGLLTFLAFTFSVIAAVLAIDMYTLLRTGEFGTTWRVLIIASVVFALLQVLRMTEALNWAVSMYGLSQIVELMFALALAYAFYLQRKTFTQAARLRGEDERRGAVRARERNDHNHQTEVVPASLVASPDATTKSDETSTSHGDNEEDAAPVALLAPDEADIEWEPRKPAL